MADETSGRPHIVFDDEDRPPLTYYERTGGQEPKIHTPGGRTIMAKEWVKAPEFVPQKRLETVQDGAIMSLRHIPPNSKRHSAHLGGGEQVPVDPGVTTSTGSATMAPRPPPPAAQAAAALNSSAQPFVPRVPNATFMPPAPPPPQRMPPPPLWPPQLSQGVMMPPPLMTTSLFGSHAFGPTPPMRHPNVPGPGVPQMQHRVSQPGPSGAGLYGNGPARGPHPLNAQHVAAVRAGALQLLPPGYSANVTTINAGVNGQPIPAIVLKKRRKKKNRRPGKLLTNTVDNHKLGSELASDTDSTATDRAPTDPAVTREQPPLSTSEYLGSESTEQSSRRSEPDLTRAGDNKVSARGCQKGFRPACGDAGSSFGASLNRGSLITTSCPDLTDAQWEMVDEFWLPIQAASDAPPDKSVTTAVYPQQQQQAGNSNPNDMREDYEVYNGAVFSAFEQSVTQRSPDLLALEQQMLIERDRQLLHDINHGDRDASVDGPSDEERLYQRLIDETAVKRSMAGVRSAGARSLLQEMADTQFIHKAVVDSHGDSHLYQPVVDANEDFTNIRITGNPFSQEVDAVIGQPRSAVYGFGSNRIFRSESEGMLHKLHAPENCGCSLM